MAFREDERRFWRMLLRQVMLSALICWCLFPSLSDCCTVLTWKVLRVVRLLTAFLLCWFHIVINSDNVPCSVCCRVRDFIRFCCTINRNILMWRSWDRASWYISIVKPTRCTLFPSLLNITLHVSDGFSVHHQESKTVHTASGICHSFVDCLLAGTRWNSVHGTVYRDVFL